MKKIIVILVSLMLITSLVSMSYISKNWTIRYKGELNRFFGEGNWECISEETKESMIYTEYISVHSNPAMSGEVPGKYKNWYIHYDNHNGQEEIWKITDHVLKINHDKYGLLSSKRYSGKQALCLELMNISFGIIGEEVFKEIISSNLSEKEANCIEVSMSYHGGNPKPEFYTALSKEPWFTADRVSAEDYLAYDLHDFYIYIRAHDYKLDKLTDQEKQNVFSSIQSIVNALLDQYGNNASFEIYFDKDHCVEYSNGTKQ